MYWVKHTFRIPIASPFLVATIKAKGIASFVKNDVLFIEILEHPENTTVFLNQTAVFRCEVTGGDVSWRVNGKPTTELTSIAPDDLDIVFENGNPLVILTIIARAEYNGTTVQCLVNSGFSDRSENASLRIQGENCDVWRSFLCFIIML